MRQTVCTIRQRVIPSLFAASVFLTLDVRASGELSSLDRRAMFNIPVMEYSFTACAAYGQTERESERTCPFVIEFTACSFRWFHPIKIHTYKRSTFLSAMNHDDNYNITAPFVHSHGEFMSSYIWLTNHLCGTKVSIYDEWISFWLLFKDNRAFVFSCLIYVIPIWFIYLTQNEMNQLM